MDAFGASLLRAPRSCHAEPISGPASRAASSALRDHMSAPTCPPTPGPKPTHPGHLTEQIRTATGDLAQLRDRCVNVERSPARMRFSLAG
jgi:hypothetical protein